jgi:hypothetical protein
MFFERVHTFLTNCTASQDWLANANAQEFSLGAACFESRSEHGCSETNYRGFPPFFEVDSGVVPQAMTAYLQRVCSS